MISGRFTAVLIFLVVVIGWIIILTRSDSRPELFPKLIGCYARFDRGSWTKIVVKPTGILNSGKLYTKVTATIDKSGLSLIPKDMIIIRRDAQIKLEKSTGYPLLLRFTNDLNYILIPDLNGPDVRFERVN